MTIPINHIEGFVEVDIRKERLNIIRLTETKIRNTIIDQTIAAIMAHPGKEVQDIRNSIRQKWHMKIYRAMTTTAGLAWLLFDLTDTTHLPYMGSVYRSVFSTSHALDVPKNAVTKHPKMLVAYIQGKPFIYTRSDVRADLYREIYSKYNHLIYEFKPTLLWVEYIKKYKKDV